MNSWTSNIAHLGKCRKFSEYRMPKIWNTLGPPDPPTFAKQFGKYSPDSPAFAQQFGKYSPDSPTFAKSHF
jgi:hypothetical protein